jgi:ATP-binding cassette subfamily F protein uup
VLVLDEPTNDLDVETLDLLQELLADYDGTVLLVSHDRDFIDRVATSTVAHEGGGRWVEYAGGWTDHLGQRAPTPQPAPMQKPASAKTPAPEPGPRSRPKLSYAQTRRLEMLPAEMDRLTREIGLLEKFLSDPTLYARDPKAFEKASAELVARRTALEAAEEEWLTLEELREAAG